MLALLTDSAALERVNATTIGGANICRLTEMGVNFDQVSGFVCDGARYMTASYQNILGLKCRPHNGSAPVINLVGEILHKKSYDVDQFVCKMKTRFRLSGKNR